MAAVVVAADAGVQHKAPVKGFSAITQMAWIVLKRAAVKRFVALGLRRQQLIQRGHRAVVQIRRCGPDPVQRPRLVCAHFLHGNRQPVTIEAILFLRADPGGGVRMLFNKGGDVRQPLGNRQLMHVQRFIAVGKQRHVHLRQLGRVPLQGADVIAVIGDVIGGIGVRADHVQCNDRQLLHAAACFVLDLRHVTPGAVFREQGAPFGGQRAVDLAEECFRPHGRFELLQGFFDQVQVMHPHTGGIARIPL